MYSMLSGDLPFWSKHESEIFEIITTGIYNLEDKIWQLISNDARDLLSKLLCIDPAKRISASEALNHS